MERFDIVIVGGGIAGASLGAELVGRASGTARRVLLIEAEAIPGMHSTGRSAAFWLESYGGPGVVALSTASHEFLSSPPADFAEQFTKNTFGALRDMVYCALRVSKGNNLPPDFDQYLTGEWLDDLQEDNPAGWAQIQTVMLHALSLGNPNRATLAAATPASA